MLPEIIELANILLSLLELELHQRAHTVAHRIYHPVEGHDAGSQQIPRLPLHLIQHSHHGSNLLIGGTKQGLHTGGLLLFGRAHLPTPVLLPDLRYLPLRLLHVSLGVGRCYAPHIGLVGRIDHLDRVEIGNLLELLELYHLSLIHGVHSRHQLGHRLGCTDQQGQQCQQGHNATQDQLLSDRNTFHGFLSTRNILIA